MVVSSGYLSLYRCIDEKIDYRFSHMLILLLFCLLENFLLQIKKHLTIYDKIFIRQLERFTKYDSNFQNLVYW